MDVIQVTPDWLVLIVAAVLSLGFSYIPGLNTWYAGFSTETKKLTQALLILIVLVASFLLQCNGLLNFNIACTKEGIMSGVITYILALSANQGVYNVSPKTAAVKAVSG